VRAPALGDAATHLAWLSPCADTLAALAAAATWPQIRDDPGGVLLLARHSAAGPPTAATLRDPEVLEAAQRYLRQPPGPPLVDWGQPAVRPVYHAALTYARLAARLAERTGRCDPDAAWVAGLAAPLGWLAVCAVAPDQAAACLDHPDFDNAPTLTQQRLWGLDQAAIARRLARHWQLPRWLAALTGHLRLPAETVQALGGDGDLFRLTQLAVGLAQEEGIALRLGVGTPAEEAAAALGLTADDRQFVRREACRLVEQAPPACGRPSPEGLRFLPELLGLAAANRRLQGVPLLDRLSDELDQLHQALDEQHHGAAQRLQTLKLTALAQLAAGAGHEINNPLAVISGQAQYLLGHEPEPARQRALQTIVSQAQRIHQILSDLMQFARPPRPQKQLLDVAGLVRDVAADLGDLAAQRRVRLLCPEPPAAVTLHADPRQLRTALTCLLRNAIEAAPADGWASVRLETPAPDRLRLVVEDSGAGPPPGQREHLFDPFFSGREAGRGRGLGLPTAWRLAREHGGDVTFDDLPRGPTRFVLSLPCPKRNGQPRGATLPPADDEDTELSPPAPLAQGHCDEVVSCMVPREPSATEPRAANGNGTAA
jgi:signal transduction histidine kinase